MQNDIDFIKVPSSLNIDDKPIKMGNYLFGDDLIEDIKSFEEMPDYYVADEQVMWVKENGASELNLTKKDKLRIAAGVIATTIVLLGFTKFIHLRDENTKEGMQDYKRFVSWATEHDLDITEENYIYFINNETNENIEGQSRGAK